VGVTLASSGELLLPAAENILYSPPLLMYNTLGYM
jgi:hypothetical protein